MKSIAAVSESLIEAAWLAAVLVIPLLLSVHSENAFELQKVTVLRLLALVMILTWAIRIVALGRGGIPGLHRGWTALALLMIFAHSASTITSLAPSVSLWGSMIRVQGVVTTAAYLVLFLSVIHLLKRREQLERLVDAILIASLPLSLYGIIQHFGTDPVAWGDNVVNRAASTLGNPIFLGALLTLTIPIALYRHLDCGRHAVSAESFGLRATLVVGGVGSLALQIVAWWIGPVVGSVAALTTLGIWGLEGRLLGQPVRTFLILGGYSVLLSAQLTCLLLTQSRGAWLATAAGLYTFALLASVTTRRWRWAWGATAAAFSVLLAVALLNLPVTSKVTAERPYVGRLTELTESTGRVRLLIWEASMRALIAEPARAFLGHGPETTRLALAPHVPPELIRRFPEGVLPDRAHNDTLDDLLTTGFVGLSIRLLLIGALVWTGLRAADLLRSPTVARSFALLFVGGGIVGIALAVLFDPLWRLAGAALPLAMIGGLLVFLLASKRFDRSLVRQRDQWTTSVHLLVAALVAALVGHVVEIQFGIAVTATRTLFWVLAAVLVVLGARRIEMAPRWSGSSPAPLLMALVLATIAHDFLVTTTSWSDAATLAWLLGLTWILGSILATARDAVSNPTTLGRYALWSLFPAGIFASLHLGWLHWREATGWVAAPHLVFLLVGLGLIGILLRPRETSPPSQRTPVALAATLIALTIIVFALWGHLRKLEADIYYRRARVEVGSGSPQLALPFARHAVEIRPDQDYYRSLLGLVLMQHAVRTGAEEQRQTIFADAEKNLREARTLSPLDPTHAANLGRLYSGWAQLTDDPSSRADRLMSALEAYEEALKLSPRHVLFWNELGATYFLAGDFTRAAESYRHSIELDDGFADTYLQLGDVYTLQGQWKAAIEAYRAALDHDKRSLHGYRAWAKVAMEMGDVQEAVRAYEELLALVPNDLAAHAALARLHFSGGRRELALRHAEEAVALATPDERPAMEELVGRIHRAEKATPH